MADKLGLTPQERTMLIDAWDYCDEEDKSTEFMLSYMADYAEVSYDTVVEFVTSWDRETGEYVR